MAAFALVAVLLGWLTAPLPHPSAQHPSKQARAPLGLFTSLPIWWAEAEDMAARLSVPQDPPGRQSTHWARTVLEQRGHVLLLDTLLAPRGFADLVMAQPRPLEPAEAAALDGWVRGGGRLLLFADPMLTWESRFALGDPRRPQDTVLLEPILAHWGLHLRFDPAQSVAARETTGTGLPVRLAGTLEALPGGDAACRIEAEGLLADCRIGAGRALILADSAVLEPADRPGGRIRGLRRLLARAFPR